MDRADKRDASEEPSDRGQNHTLGAPPGTVEVRKERAFADGLAKGSCPTFCCRSSSGPVRDESTRKGRF